jgi:hypothetical protein
MRKWARDAHRHGMQIGLTRSRAKAGGGAAAGGGIPYYTVARVTDGNNVRITDEIIIDPRVPDNAL